LLAVLAHDRDSRFYPMPTSPRCQHKVRSAAIRLTTSSGSISCIGTTRKRSMALSG